MTIAATATFELNVATIIRRAYQVCGLYEASQTPEGDDAAMARDFLNLELDALQAEGVLRRSVERDTQTLADGTAEYTLDDDALDVFVGPDNVAGTILQSGASTETRVYIMSRHEYVGLNDKLSESVPTKVFIEKTATCKAIFWPVPNATMTFKFQKIRLVRDVTDTSSTADVERKRQKAIIWALAYDLGVAKSIPLERLREIKSERNALKSVAYADDVEPGHGQLVVE